jgi:hypothetical protein
MRNMLIGFILGWVCFTASGREYLLLVYGALDTAGATIIDRASTDIARELNPNR